jgi:hypothetical protein
MLKYISMYTPMETKLNLLVDTLSELVDATLYRQIIGSVMYLMITMPDICFALSQYLVETNMCSHCCCKTYDEVP